MSVWRQTEAPPGELPELNDATDLRVMNFLKAVVNCGGDTAASIDAVPDGASLDDLGNTVHRLNRLGLIRVNRDGDVKVLALGKQWLERHGPSLPPTGVPNH